MNKLYFTRVVEKTRGLFTERQRETNTQKDRQTETDRHRQTQTDRQTQSRSGAEKVTLKCVYTQLVFIQSALNFENL